MGRRELLAAEVAVVELEDELAAAKEYGAAEMEMKLRLREARYRFRTLREGGDPDSDPNVEPGDAVVRPATVKSKGRVR
jgi:hypothetical protein